MNKNLIIDVGMHKGEDTEFYLKKGFKVVAIEANKNLCQQVECQLKHYIDTGQLTIINVAIVEESGPTEFYINERVTEWSTTKKSWVKRNEAMNAASHKCIVQGVAFKEILQEYGVPYYLKIDIEGNDLLCLKTLESFESKPRYISIESVKTSLAELREEFMLLIGLGYAQFKVVNQFHVHRQSPPALALEGQAVNHKFKAGSSGLFGEEAPGIWRGLLFSMIKYKFVFFRYWLVGNNGIWPNIHLKFKPNTFLKKTFHPHWYDTHAKLKERD